MIPKPTASNFVVRVACVSVSLTLQPDCIKSLDNQILRISLKIIRHLRVTAARELRPLETVERAPEKTPATNKPGTPG